MDMRTALNIANAPGEVGADERQAALTWLKSTLAKVKEGDKELSESSVEKIEQGATALDAYKGTTTDDGRVMASHRVRVDLEDVGQPITHFTLELATPGRFRIVEAGPGDSTMWVGLIVAADSIEEGDYLQYMHEGNAMLLQYQTIKVLQLSE